MSYVFRDMTIPDEMVEHLTDYVEHGYVPGQFLSAVICNDLVEACSRADDGNLPIIAAYAAWLYNEAPSACWGSRTKMLEWETQKEDERQSNAAAAERQKREDDADARGDAAYDQMKDDRMERERNR